MRRNRRRIQEERLLQRITAEVETRFEHAVMRRALDAPVLMQNLRSAQWSFAIDYSLHVQDSVREFADLLAQAVIAGKGKITLKAWLWILDEALRFVSVLTSWEDMAGTFVATSLNITGKDRADKVDVTLRAAFEQEVEPFLSNWAIEANNAITLRCMLSARPSTPASPDDLIKVQIARIKGDNPGITQREICARMDARGTPALKTWQSPDDRTWVGAYDGRHKKAVKSYISKIEPSPPSKPASVRLSNLGSY
jgi:hypothetical protein